MSDNKDWGDWWTEDPNNNPFSGMTNEERLEAMRELWETIDSATQADWIIAPEEIDELDDDEEISLAAGSLGRLVGFDEIAGVCQRHIEEGNIPYTEEQALKIMKWMEETKLNTILLNLLLDGKIDVIYDEEKIKKYESIGDFGLLFGLTEKGRIEAREGGDNSDEDLFDMPPEMRKFFDISLDGEAGD